MCELYTFCIIFCNSHYLIDYQKLTSNNYVIKSRTCKHTMQCLLGADMECTIPVLNVKRMCSFISVVFTKHVLLEEVVRAWVFYEPRWKRSDECSSATKPKSDHAVDDHHFLQNISCTYVISFFVGFFVTCILLVVISTLTQVVHMCYEYQCLVMQFSWCSQVLCDYYYQLCSSQNDIRCLEHEAIFLLTLIFKEFNILHELCPSSSII